MPKPKKIPYDEMLDLFSQAVEEAWLKMSEAEKIDFFEHTRFFIDTTKNFGEKSCRELVAKSGLFAMTGLTPRALIEKMMGVEGVEDLPIDKVIEQLRN